ncbi:FecR domain-containing protein [Novosphingobium sp. KA1]|uniref:FecR family protein n=1 Tax=Novosphingobium sp. (strain KA1) TaxID=164608 RepID=UPI001A8E3C14|nr:FecR domain-containing protein [Novosphingobium sp. KA1]
MPSIDDIAGAWAMRGDAGVLDAAEQAELDAWLDADRRHRGAFVRAQAVLNLLDAVPRPEAEQAGPRWQRWIRPAAVAAAVGGLAAMAASLALFLLGPTAPDYATEIGEQRQVTLADGSLAALNTGSQLDVAYSHARRDLTLRQGEAWFRVAHNRARPFEVTVGRVHVRATGTAFSVRSVAQGVRVVVSEGRVLAWVDGSGQRPMAIARGDEALLRTDIAVQAPPVAVDVDQALAWRRGEIGLDGETGLQAAAEFNRYSLRPIRIRNPRAAQYRLVGYFQTSQAQEFAQALASLTHAKVSSNGNEIVIE